MRRSFHTFRYLSSTLILACLTTAPVFAQETPLLVMPPPPTCETTDTTCLIIEENERHELSDIGAIGFVGIEEDSRCPVDVLCFWGGQVKVVLNRENGETVEKFQIGLGGKLSPTWIDVATGKQIILEQVWPEPNLSQPVEKPYQIKVRIVDAPKDEETVIEPVEVSDEQVLSVQREDLSMLR